ncbi:MAG: aspartate aminotransferase family protein [Planctomycetota bacterium]|jgi:acetylornithine aminotransferase/acetylornithine/N-succinyldiaminopimelate aminotransferase
MNYATIEGIEQQTELDVYRKFSLAPVRGEGVYIDDVDGTRYLDLYGGHAVALTGHCHPHVVEAIRHQAGELLFYSNAVRSLVRAHASQALLAHAPWDEGRVFYVNSGAEANEVALKIARKATGRRVVISFEGGFHGRTIATLSACPIQSYRNTAAPLPLIEDHRVVPWDDVPALEKAFSLHHFAGSANDVAAVLLEPIQSIGGVREASAEFYRALRQLTTDHGAALIFDEIQTGMGRTGTFFYGEHHDVKPDLITLAKGIASGVPCAAVLASPAMASSQGYSDQGSTFGGGPLAMAAMQATIEVIEREKLCANAASMEARIRERVEPLEGVVEIRGRGLLLGVVLDRDTKPVRAELLKQRVIVGGSGVPEVMRILAPLTLEAGHVDTFADALDAALRTTRQL